METQRSPSPSLHKPEPGAPYCSDPSCSSCKELRETHELVRTGKPIPQKTMKLSA